MSELTFWVVSLALAPTILMLLSTLYNDLRVTNIEAWNHNYSKIQRRH